MIGLLPGGKVMRRKIKIIAIKTLAGYMLGGLVAIIGFLIYKSVIALTLMEIITNV